MRSPNSIRVIFDREQSDYEGGLGNPLSWEREVEKFNWPQAKQIVHAPPNFLRCTIGARVIASASGCGRERKVAAAGLL
jgi:hypothetical protein